MHFLNFPVEIRLGIYSELLVRDDPVEFGADHGPRNPRLIRVGKQGLNPALLRVNKMVNREAIPFLYSNNRFRFPDAYTSFNAATDSISYSSDVPYIAPFLQQIGANAGLLRHICINFLTSFAPANWRKPVLREEHVQVLQLIRETCPGLRTVEISCEPPDSIFSLCDVDLAAEMLRALDDGGFKAMLSLEKIVVVCGEYDINEEVMALRESLMQRMPSFKWSIELTKVPPRVWISDDDRVEFDNYEDCCRYNNEMYRREMEREEREEREQWEEEYYRRRNDPYWKNDSDYD
ncbi:hypothetical protein AAE478_008397 [Parahypoxylon ruwenzoriense]